MSKSGSITLSPISSEFLENQDSTDYSTRITNAVIRKRETGEGRPFLSQRPGFTQVDPTATTGEAVMRASYLAADFKQFHVTRTKLWLNLFATEITVAASASAITSGHDKMYMEELNNDLIILNPENNEGKWMDGLGTTVYYDMDTAAGNGGGTFTNFPPILGKQLAHGIATLDRTLYVLTDLGEIWGSDLNDASSWSDPLNFIRAERAEDTKYYLTRHHDNLVVFGATSIEFFYNAGNPVGSPLARRTDVYYNIGLLDPRSVWKKEDIVYFIGRSTNQAVGVYKLENYEITKISTESIDYVLGDEFVADPSAFYRDVVLGTTSATVEGYWPFDTEAGLTVSDISGNNYDLTRNASTTIEDAQIEQGIDYNAIVNVRSSGSHSFAAGYFDDWTIEAWVYTREDPAVAKPILQLYNGGSPIFGINVYTGSSFPTGPASIRIISPAGTNDATDVLSLNAWHHVAVSRVRNGNFEVYVDGVNVLSTASGASQTGAVDTLWSGADVGSVSLDGLVDELVLYSGELSEADVKAHFASGSPEDPIGFTYGLGSGMSWNGEDYYIITTYYLTDDVLPQATYIYNSKHSVWTRWTYGNTENSAIPCINSYASLNRNILFLTDGTYMVHSVVTPNTFFIDTYASATHEIPVTIKLSPWDNGNNNWKYIHQLRFIGEQTSAAALVTIQWLDENTGGAATGSRTIDIQDLKNKLTRLGRTKRRSFAIQASITSQLVFEGLELQFGEGTH